MLFSTPVVLVSVYVAVSVAVVSTDVVIVIIVFVIYDISVFVPEHNALIFLACHRKLVYGGNKFGWHVQYCPFVSDDFFAGCKTYKVISTLHIA